MVNKAGAAMPEQLAPACSLSPLGRGGSCPKRVHTPSTGSLRSPPSAHGRGKSKLPGRRLFVRIVDLDAHRLHEDTAAVIAGGAHRELHDLLRAEMLLHGGEGGIVHVALVQRQLVHI